MNHLRYSQSSDQVQTEILTGFLLETDWMLDALQKLQNMNLVDSWITAGAIYNLAWNRLTNRPSHHGMNDIDIAYFDDSDLSWEAEDKVIKRGDALFKDPIKPIEIRNQARVHLWFPKHFGFEIAPLTSSREAVQRYSAKVHCVAARLDQNGSPEIYAPYGLGDLFSFLFRPNYAYNENKAAYGKKAVRAKALWSELQVQDWDVKA